jgi:hypothetical protein
VDSWPDGRGKIYPGLGIMQKRGVGIKIKELNL